MSNTEREAGLRAVLKAKKARALSEAATLQQLREGVTRLETARKALLRSLSAPGEAMDIATMQAEADWRAVAIIRCARLEKTLESARRDVLEAERLLARTIGESRGIETLLDRARTTRRVAREAAEENNRSVLAPRNRS